MLNRTSIPTKRKRVLTTRQVHKNRAQLKKPFTRYPFSLATLGLSILTLAANLISPQVNAYLAFHPEYLKHILTFPLGLFELVSFNFAHGNISHLLGNFSLMLPLLIYCEMKQGSKRTFVTYLVTGMTAGLLYAPITHQWDVGLIGSSAAAFGILALACVTFMSECHGDVLLAVLYFGGLFIPQLILMSLSLGGYLDSTIAFAGHVVGGCAGILMGIYYRFVV